MSDIMMFSDIEWGDPIVLPEEAISDWVISKPDGSEEGNLIGLELERIGDCIPDHEHND